MRELMFRKRMAIRYYLFCKSHCAWVLLLEKISDDTCRIRPANIQSFRKMIDEFLMKHGTCHPVVAEEAEFMPPTGVIRDDLLAQLKKIQPSRFDGAELRPCRIILKNGTALNNVYIIDADTYRKISGPGPGEYGQDDRFVPITEIASIEDSPQRIPADLATKMYRAGESGMGYYVFTLVLHDGRRLPYVTSGLADFVQFPVGMSPSMVKDLLPHKGKEQLQDAQHHWKDSGEFTRGPQFLWCLYKLPDR